MAPTRDAYLPGVPCWIDLRQPDPEAARSFYGGLFGWSFTDEPYAIASIDGRAVAAVAPGDGRNWNMYVAVSNIEATAEKVTAAGGRTAGATEDVEVGRLAPFVDSVGASFLVWEARQFPGAQLVNAPGAWNFNDLATGDQEGAERFYGAVFGWEVTEMEFGKCWRRPGYGDHLVASDPSLQAMRDVAPEGFFDAVAWLNPGNGDAHWNTTWGVADCDASVARAVELGARVVVEPFDAPYIRASVVEDPQGGVITLSQYVPPAG
jgi:predicted enzyme related to lactoylglutathione lyase